VSRSDGVVVQRNILVIEPPPRPLPSVASTPPGQEGQSALLQFVRTFIDRAYKEAYAKLIYIDVEQHACPGAIDLTFGTALSLKLARIKKAPGLSRGLFLAGFSLFADLNTVSRSAATTASGAAAGRDNLDPKDAIALVVRGARGVAQCIQAVLCRACGCGGESR